jgi:predicted ATP-grasp superfamily ATP-dependent carboligase
VSTGGRRTRVLLAGPDHRSTLATIRSLARRGITTTFLGVGESRVVTASRYVTDYVAGPDPAVMPESFVEVVGNVARSRGATLLIPLDDASLAAGSRARDELPADLVVAAPDSGAVLGVLDKRSNLERAERLGIPCPRQFELRSPGEIPRLATELGFPVVIKNPGQYIERGRVLSFKWVVAHDERDVHAFVRRHPIDEAYPLVQEYVTGAVRNICCFAVRGEIAAAHEYLGLRRWNGESALREITETTPLLLEYAERMLRDLEWDGVAHIGFIVSDVDGVPRYMETNGRLWGSIESSIRMGWDFPAWIVDYFAGGVAPTAPAVDVGSRACWHYGDLRGLALYLARGVPPTSRPRGRLRSVADYLSAFRPGIGSDMFRRDDPMPEVREHWRGVRELVAYLTPPRRRR